MNQDDLLTHLKGEVERTDAQTERECAKLLQKIAWVLLSSADGNTTFVTSEQICSTGRVDLVVLANSMQPGRNLRREAHIWELKAPQLSLFEVKTKNRAHPSEHLYSAETQLMHYFYSVCNDGGLLNRWEILSSDHVRLGGIIIGRDTNFIDYKGVDKTLGNQLAREAHEIREVFFYRSINMKLWTWDKVISLAEPLSHSHQKINGDPNAVIDIQGSADSTGTIIAELVDTQNDL